ncbi:vitamin K epoxide reductase family protein [Cellulomonas sp. Marseille-Q8402]
MTEDSARAGVRPRPQTAADPIDPVDDDPDSPPRRAWRRRTAIEMVVSGVIGLYTSFVLSIEAWHLAADPDATFRCDISSVISCGTVARTWQAQLLGFPNAFLGIAFEVVVITISVAAIGGVRFPRWFMLGTQVVYTIALLFAYWLFLQSYFVIGALCPWCLLITVTTTLVWAGLTRWNVRDGHLRLPGGAGPWARGFVAAGYDWYVTAAWLVLFLAMILLKYGPSLLAA